jgi:zinc transport system substrate-binding protein
MVLMLGLRASSPAVVIALSLSALAGCGDDADDSSSEATSNAGVLQIEASFYPLQWMAEQVGGDHVSVGSLTPPGAEPHDLELTPADVASVSEADLVVYLSGFQAAVDDAVGEADDDAVFDVAPAANLDLTFTPIEEGEQHEDEAGAVDPHFWLDPTRLAAVADAFADKLSEIDPSHADDYATNRASLTDDLNSLDDDLMTGLADCANTNLVTSHNAFGYLARRYHLTQVGITGLTPEGEPSPADLAAVTEFVADNDVTTIYFETLVSPDIADTVAAETGARTDVLDPIEGLNDQSQGNDYLEVMTANLASLRRGQSCS